MAKKTKLIFLTTIIFATSNVFLNYLLIPRYGINGAASATSISLIIGGYLRLFFSHKIIKTYPIEKSFWRLFVSAILAISLIYLLAGLFFKPVSLIGLIIIILLFSLLYLLFLILFKTFEKEDIELLHVIARKVIRKRKS